MSNKGFTLIELLVVIAIIGLLSSVVLASLGNARVRAQNASRQETVRSIQNALELYYLANNTYPPIQYNNCGGTDGTIAGVGFLQPLVSGGFLPATIRDPGNVSCGIQYIRDSASSYRVFWTMTGVTAPSGGCNQPPTWYCIQP